MAGCRQSRQADGEADAAAQAIVKNAERGPVKVTVRLDRGKTRIADPVTLTVQAMAPEGVDVEMPELEGEPDELDIAQSADRPAVPVDGSRQWTRTFTVESIQPGDRELPEITVKYTDRRDASTEPVQGSVSIPSIKIEVASMLEGEFDPTKFRDIKGTVPVPAPTSWTWLWWLLGVIAIAALIYVLVRLRRRRLPAIGAARPVSPDHWARDQLRRLERERLIERGLIHEFYFRLSGIVREYIERRFEIKAPERTTDEFLVEVQGHPALKTDHQQLLGEFLRAADMVKFARYEPQAAEIDGALATARTFVDQTTPTTTPAAPETAEVAA